MQRTIEIANFELPRGPITIGQLMGMPHETWDHLRLEINRRRQKEPDRPLARCRLCRGPVFVRSQYLNGAYAPLFSHYADAPSTCPWYLAANLTPDDARAAQYRGHQETALHRWMCETIGELVAMDSRCSLVTVETYRRPAIEQRGRYPDVYAEIDGLGKFAIEVQLAKPFPMEVVARQLHYEAENVSLIWVFRELPAVLPQGFRDVITLHRGNAFVFDDDAVSNSVEQKGLMLNAYLGREPINGIPKAASI